MNFKNATAQGKNGHNRKFSILIRKSKVQQASKQRIQR